MTQNSDATLAVIVPIFNVEKYLPECLESIERQLNFSELQVIVVNDGSTDSSAAIAQAFALKHPNVEYLSQPNQGPGAARNLGLEAVTAGLVTFLDSDDRVPERAYFDLVLGMQSPEVDVAVGKMASFPKTRSFIWDAAFRQGTRTISGICEQHSLIHSASAGNKVFRMDETGFATLRFPTGVHFEDAMVVLPILVASPRIYVLDSVVYEYRKRDVHGSIMDAVFERSANYFDYLDLVEHLSEFALRLTSKKRMILEEFIVRGTRGFVKRASEKLSGSELEEFKDRAYEVVSKIDLGVLEQFSVDPTHRLAFADLLVNGEGGTPKISAIEIIGDSAYSGFIIGRKDNNLRRASHIAAAIESISPGVGGEIVVEGRVDFRGLSADEPPRADIGINLGARHFPGEWTCRADRARSGGFWSGFRVSIPVDRWPVGEYFPRVWISSDSGRSEARAKKTIRYFKSARPFVVDGKRFELSANRKNQVGVRTRRFGKLARLKRGPGELVSAWRDYRKGRAFALKRILLMASKPFFRESIWLIGERWDTAQDNGAALFRYLSTHEPKGVKCYYAVERGTSAYSEMSAVGRVVAMGSLKHLLLLLNSSVVMNAFDVDTYSTPRSWTTKSFVENLLPYMKAKRVFLQHGVTYRDVARGVHRLVQGYDLVTTTAGVERDYFAQELDYGPRAVDTGFPRFDSLGSAGEKKVILFAPTWRHHLATPSYSKTVSPARDVEIVSSLYYQSIREFLSHDQLGAMLEANDATVRFLPHYEVSQYFRSSQFGDRIQVVDQGESSFQQELNEASMLITDYSSTFFDMAYAGKPVIYFNFDEQDFELSNPSLKQFSLQQDGFGPCCPTVEGVIEAAQLYVESRFEREEVYAGRAHKFFTHIDKSNAERVVQEVLRL